MENKTSKAKYALFCGSYYYPEGGASDFETFGKVEELKNIVNGKGMGESQRWAEIVDPETMEIVWVKNGTGEWTRK